MDYRAGGHGVALLEAARTATVVGLKMKSPAGRWARIASDGTLGAGHDDFGMGDSGTVVGTPYPKKLNSNCAAGVDWKNAGTTIRQRCSDDLF